MQKAGQNDHYNHMNDYYYEGSSEEEYLYDDGDDDNDDGDADFYISSAHGDVVDEYYFPNEMYGDQSDEGQLLYLYRNCMIPTILQILNHLKLLLFLCFLFNLVTSLLNKGFAKGMLSHRLYEKSVHCTSLLSGFIALYSFQTAKISSFISLILMVYLLLHLCEYFSTKNIRGPIVAFVVMSYLIICEAIIFEKLSWHTIRGTQMILSMKLISLSFDIDKGIVKHIPEPIHLLGYSFHVGSLIFGPWISYTEYLNCYNYTPSFTIPGLTNWLIRCTIAFIKSLICLLASTCFSELIASNGSHKWFQAYKEALSFRFSHYFVCKLSETTYMLSTNRDVIVTKIPNIEMPRSLVDVVVCWNIPMHKWLKIYIFQTSRSLGNFASILLTYLISALLHGLNFQLSAVLLSLGVYSYIEYNLRRKLSTLMSACIDTRLCRSGCQHKHQQLDLVVITTNLIFFFIAIFHLAYLGCTFDDDDIQTQGYSMQHTLSKWGRLSYASPLLAFMMMAINWII